MAYHALLNKIVYTFSAQFFINIYIKIMNKKNFYFRRLVLISTLTISFSIIFETTFKNGKGSLAYGQTNQQSSLRQGTKTLLNNREINLPWVQWQGGNIGVSDIALQNILGVELLNTNRSNEQPVKWFNSYETLPANFVNPYRYLDIANLTKNTNISFEIEQDILKISTPDSFINRVYDINQPDQKRVVIELEKPTFFRVSQARDKAVIVIEGNLRDGLLPKNGNSSIDPFNNTNILEDEGDQIRGMENILPPKSLFTLEKQNNYTLVHIDIPTGHNVNVNSSNPNLLFVELRPDAMSPKNISWSDDINWQDKYVTINNPSRDTFFVSLLSVNLDNTRLDLRPIVFDNSTVINTSPLITIAQNQGAIAAINGGFFNRNNQLPLGAIKNRNQWQSTPILNRGVIAWDNAQNVKISRAKFEEVITNSKGDRIISNYINSGYIQKGVSRYTPSWGTSYNTLSDNETIIIVENGRIRDKINIPKAGSQQTIIPPNGYLIVLRNSPELTSKFSPNELLQINTTTTPPDLSNYPYMLGAGPVLLLNSQIALDAQAEGFSAAFNNQRASRSGVAIDNQGKLMFIAVHQRINGPGPSLQEFAQILQQLGAVDALNLDGGSSTQIYLGGTLIDRSPVTAARVHNGLGLFLRPRN